MLKDDDQQMMKANENNDDKENSKDEVSEAVKVDAEKNNNDDDNELDIDSEPSPKVTSGWRKVTTLRKFFLKNDICFSYHYLSTNLHAFLKTSNYMLFKNQWTINIVRFRSLEFNKHSKSQTKKKKVQKILH